MLRGDGGKEMNVNELRSALTNIQISFKGEKEQIAFSNAKVVFMIADRLPWIVYSTLSIKDIVYEDGLVKLKPVERGEEV